VNERARFLLIRHAESTWNAEGRWQGQADPPLSALGREQARELGRALAGRDIRALVASDLARAAETARILGEVLGLSPRLDARLRELDVGEWSGLSRDEVVARWPETYERLRAGDVDARPDGGETFRELRVRVHEALLELAQAHPVGLVAVVTHGGAIRSLLPGTRTANAAVVPFAPGDEPLHAPD
jgi:broad specificity phosphatase PhoE